tara:strand:+ start:35160 stop:38639 length:3480 start_codon:yes stop_codon:yes gene_type:complete
MAPLRASQFHQTGPKLTSFHRDSEITVLIRPILFVLLLACVSVGVHAQSANFTLPGVADLEKQLTGGAENKDAANGPNGEAEKPSGERQQLLQETLDLRREIDQNRERAKELKQQSQQAPQQQASQENALESTRRERELDWQSRYASLSLEALVDELVKQLNALENNQETLAKVSSQLTSSQTLPERAQNTISDSLARMDEIRHRLGDARNSGQDELNDLQRTRLQTELTALETRIELRNQELSVASTLEELAEARKELLEAEAELYQQRLDALQPMINQRRIEELRAQLSAEDVQLPESLSGHPLLKAAREQNQALSERLQQVGSEVNDLIRESISSKTRLDRVRSLSSTVNDQIRMLDGSLLLSRILYEQQKSLPEPAPGANLQKGITDTRLAQFDIDQKRRDLGRQPPRVDDSALSDSERDQIQTVLNRLHQAHAELLDQLDQELGRKLNVMVRVQLNQEQLDKTINDLRNVISEQTFWMPSTQPLSLQWFNQFPAQVREELDNIPWADLKTRSKALLSDKGGWLLLPMVLAGALLLLRRILRPRIRRLNNDIGFLKRDSQRHTPLSILYTAVLCAPVPVVFSLVAWGLWLQPGTLSSVLAATLLKIGLLWLVFELCYRLLADNGIAQRQFRWSKEKNLQLRRRLLVVGLTMVPMTLVIAFGEQWPSQLSNDRIGLVTMVAGLLLISAALCRAALVYPTRSYSRAFKGLTTTLCAGIPLVLVALIGLGYYYTSVRLSGRMIDSFYLLLLWILCDATAVRGLAVAAQRLAYKRAVAQREAEPKDNPEGVEVEEPQLDLQQVNQQSLRLIRLALVVGFGVLLYLVWADILNAFSYTDNILLWQTTEGQGVNATDVPISLGDVMTSLAIGVTTILLASNLPGLLEVLLLSRLTLRPGTSYATTTLLSYVIVVVGIIIALGTLGLSWSKMQWLVAALGVGLGFGLQEIFANFISGIIILFERPIRIGDVITINNLSGTVSRIRIRATTVFDFDHKEIIIPNKTFVTERLINWSLTDNITRVTLKLGFAYGSDLAMCRDILERAARENPRVLRDPEPLILFMAFGESSLEHELRVHVKEIGDILYATDELNRAIAEACREHNVEIAFNQLDIHLRSMNEDEVVVRGDRRDFHRKAGRGGSPGVGPAGGGTEGDGDDAPVPG